MGRQTQDTHDIHPPPIFSDDFFLHVDYEILTNVYLKRLPKTSTPNFSDNLVMSATIFWCDDWESRQWRFSITAMCRDGVATRFDVLRNSYNACDAAAMDKSWAHEAQRILKAVESN